MSMRISCPGPVCLGSAQDAGSGEAVRVPLSSSGRVRAAVAEIIAGAVTLIVALTLGTLVAPLTAGAQPAAKVPRIGVLHAATPAAVSQNVEAFRQGLREHGYVEGQNIVVERRFGEARPERIAEAAAELVRLKVDVIVTSTDGAIAAIKRQTQ